jgi:Spy/CpxP family protein refolding chaperone
LTSEQAREVQGALDDYVLYYQNLQGQMEDIRSQGHKRIMKILTPEQQKKFERMSSDLSRRVQ